MLWRAGLAWAMKTMVDIAVRRAEGYMEEGDSEGISQRSMVRIYVTLLLFQISLIAFKE